MFGKKKKPEKTDVFKSILDRASGSNARIILPEGHDPRVLEATEKVAEMGLCKIILLGDKITLASRLSKRALKSTTIIDPKSQSKRREMYAHSLYELRKEKGMTEDAAMEQLKDNLTYAMMMLKSDDAEGVVAGAVRESADVLKTAFRIIKHRADITKVSSSMILEMPSGSNLGGNGLMVFSDPAVNENPTDAELADIAFLSAETAKTICNIKPVVAFLSFTTKAPEDANNDLVQKVKRGYKMLRRKNPSIIVDGEMQADAALSPEVCSRKCRDSVVEGKANVLVFPDIASGNISYKLVQRVAGVRAIGPILQGLNRPVNDLSRGCTADEIVLNIAITVLQSKNTVKGSY